MTEENTPIEGQPLPAMEPMAHVCQNCYYAVRNPESDRKLGDNTVVRQYTCHAAPPGVGAVMGVTRLGVPQPLTVTSWPIINEFDWCGWWHTAEGMPPPPPRFKLP